MAQKGVKRVVNERLLNGRGKQAKAWPPEKREFLHDAIVPGAVARVHGGSGRISLGMLARFPLHPTHPTFRKIADYSGAPSLNPWRQTVRDWHGLIGRGIDPSIERERRKAAALREQINTFAAVWMAFYEQHASKLAKADEAKRAGSRFMKVWGARPASEIAPDEIAAHIRAIAQRTPAEARNQFGHLSRCFTWAIGSGGFGLTHNPCRALRPSDLIGRKVLRDRILNDDELRAVWQAAEHLGFPYGPVIQMLILTGQRLNEVAGMAWSEIDFDNQLWTIPATRMKGGRAHEVPLAPDALALLKSLPQFNGPYVFTTTGGKKAVNGFSRAKERLDKQSGVTGFVLHDLRRSVRTHLSALPVQDMVRELVIAHARPGLHRIYDQFAYRDEKRECLELWEARLHRILSPKPPADVADLDEARSRRESVA